MMPALVRSAHPSALAFAAAVPTALWIADGIRVRRRAHRDPLTGLLRRDSFTAKAHRILRRHGDDVLVAMVDLDHFKAINDRFGHEAGDTVLATTADRLAAWAGPRAATGRLGGDEFATVLPTEPSHRGERLAALVELLHTPITPDGGQPIPAAASVGAASPHTLGTRNLSQLRRAADAALYEGKHSGRPVLATARHAAVPSRNGRRIGRPGTAAWGRAA